MRIIECIHTKNDCYKAAQKMTPAGIVVHSTGANNKTLKRYVDCPSEVGKNLNNNHWNMSAAEMGRSVCVHAFIGTDINNKVAVAHILPYNYCCWGVGSGTKGSYNYNPAYIQFEMCEDSLTDKAYFEEVRDTAIEYCAYLCKEFNLKVENIVSHKEAHALGYGSNHGDPDNWWKNFGYTMDQLRAAVKAKLNQNSDSKPVETPTVLKTLYRVQVGAYSVKANAEAMLKKLKDAGFDGYIKSESSETVTDTKPAEPEKPKKTVDELAKEVIKGLWGNGQDRKNRLTAAGYDYDAVQKRVNEIMGG